MRNRNKEKQKIWSKKHYDKSRRFYIDKKKFIRKRNKDFVNSMKDQPCIDCGQRYPSYVMDFDHLKNKKYNIAKICDQLTNIESILAEIAKCELVCSNCHRIRTYKRQHSEIV